jgi:hybrid cluster-associated redox disulfide protein
MATSPISTETIVGELLLESPDCVRPFLDHKMLCVGCPVARFHDIAYACDKHDVDLDAFIAALRVATDYV